jgi:hypothetical protein
MRSFPPPVDPRNWEKLSSPRPGRPRAARGKNPFPKKRKLQGELENLADGFPWPDEAFLAAFGKRIMG